MALKFLRDRLAETYSPVALAAGLAALAAVLWFLWMHTAIALWPAPYPFEHAFQADVDSPALALELARNAGDRAAVLHPADRKTSAAVASLRLYERLSWPFILFYAAYFALLGRLFAARKVVFAAIGALLAADLLKTVLALQLLAGGSAPVVFATFARWLLLALVLALFALRLVNRSGPPYSLATNRLFALAYWAIALLLVLAVCFAQYRWLALGNRLFLFTVFLNGLGLAGPLFSIPGIQLHPDPDFCFKRHSGGSASL